MRNNPKVSVFSVLLFNAHFLRIFQNQPSFGNGSPIYIFSFWEKFLRWWRMLLRRNTLWWFERF